MIDEKVLQFLEKQKDSSFNQTSCLVLDCIFDLLNGDISTKSNLMYASAAQTLDGEPLGCIAVTAHNDEYLKEKPSGRWGPPTLIIDPLIIADDLEDLIQGEGGDLYIGDKLRYSALASRLKEAAAKIESIIDSHSDRVITE